MDSAIEAFCAACNRSIEASARFCPNCGAQIGGKGLSTSIGKQVVIYLVSFFLAPLGLWYAWKYLKQGDKISKRISFASMALTVISLIVSIWTTMELLRSFVPLIRQLMRAY